MFKFEPIYFAPIAKLGGGWIAFKDSPSPPPAPDYTGAALAQGAANKESAVATLQGSNPNINTPYGSQAVSWANDPNTGNPIPTVNQTLAPAQQSLLDSQNRLSQNIAGVAEQGVNRVGEAVAQPFDTSNVRPLQADAAARQQAQNAAYGNATARLDPQWNMAGDQNETKLRNQGLVPGGEAYDNAMRNFNFGKNDAYSQAYNNSFNTGLAAQQSDFGMQNQANTANLQQQAYLRSLPLNELNAMRTGAQVQNPTFQPYQGTTVQPAPIFAGAQAQGTANQNMYNTQAGAANSFNSGLMGMAGTIGGMYAGSPAGGAAIKSLFG